MQDDFYRSAEETFQAAGRHRDVIGKVRHNASKNPILLALAVVHTLPNHLEEARTAGLKAWGVDLDDKEQIRRFEPQSVIEAQNFMWWANRQQIYRACLELIDKLSESLAGAGLAEATCAAFLEAAEVHLYTAVEDFERLHSELPGDRFQEELAKVLAGIIATRTSLHRNVSLRAAIDRLREHSPDKSMARERFEQLLKELLQEVLAIWDEEPRSANKLSRIRVLPRI